MEKDAEILLNIETNEKLDEISKNTEASLISQDETKEAIKELQPALDATLIQSIENTEKIVEAVEKSSNVSIEIKGADLIKYKGEKGDKGDKGEKGDDGKTPTNEELVALIEPLIPEPIKGEDGQDYILTEKDKKEIASAIKVPIVEKVIEKTETIIEKPITIDKTKTVVKEVAKYETAKELATKLNTLTKAIDFKVIKNFPDFSKNGGSGLNTVFTDGTTIAGNGLADNPLRTLGGGGGAVDSVNGQTGVVVLDTGDIADSLNARYVTDAQLTVIGNTSGTNTGDQDLSSYLTSATAASTYQPLDTQLTSVAGLSYTGNAGKFIRVNAGETDFELATVGGSGTVTSVAMSVPTGLTITGSPITTTGTLAVALDTGYVIPLQTTLDGYVKTDQTVGQTIGSTGARLTKLWATDLTVTNAIAGSITGNAATVTTNANLSGDVTSVGNTTTIANGAVDIGMLSATGTPSGTTYLRGDNTWATVSGLSWGSSISGTTADGVTLTLSNSSDDAASALKLIAGNTQANQSALANLQLGTSGNVQGLLIQGTGSGTLGAVGTGANHLTLWGDTASNDNIVFAVGNEVAFTEHFNIRAHGGMTTDWGTIPANPSFRYGWNITVGDAGGNNSSGIRQTWGNTQTNTGGMANLTQVGTSTKVNGLVVRGTLGSLGSDYTSEGTGVYVHGNTASQNKQAFATGNEAVPSTTWYVSTAGQTVQNLVIATTSANNVTLPNSVTSAKAGYEVTLGNTQANSPYGFLANVGTSAKVTGAMVKGTFGTATTGLTSAFTAWGNTAAQATRAFTTGNGTSYTETAFINTDGKATFATLTTTGNIELGHATDTTLARVSAGVISVEGVTIPTISSTSTLTNKRIQPRTASSTTSSNLSPDLSTANVYYRTTQTATLTIDAPIGTPVIGETIMIYVDSAGAQTLTINSTYKAFGAAFPATTTAGKTFMMSAQYNGTDWKTLWANAV